jgi:hypothetical protein
VVDIDGAASGESRSRLMTKTPKYFTPLEDSSSSSWEATVAEISKFD